MEDITKTLEERGKNYGSFPVQAMISQNLKDLCRATAKWDDLTPDQKEAIDMIVHKIARILNGNPNFHDSWFDIIGYAKLVADRLETGAPCQKK